MKIAVISIAIATCTAACSIDTDHPGDDGAEHVGRTTQSVVGCTDPTLPFFRYYNGTITDHFYTTNFGELGGGALGYASEGLAGRLFPSSFASCGAVALYRFFNAASTDHFYTTDFNEGAGMTFEGVAGYCFPFEESGFVPLLRYFNGSVVDHFYTTNFGELGNGGLGYTFEGIQCFVAQ